MDDDKLLQLFNQLTQSNKDYVLNIVESLLKSQDLFKDFVPDSQRKNHPRRGNKKSKGIIKFRLNT